MPQIRYLIEDKDELKKCYLIKVDLYPSELNMLQLDKILRKENAEILAVIGNGSVGADQVVYVVCDSLNASKRARNILVLNKASCHYSEEAYLPALLLEEVIKAGVAELFSADMKVALLDYYLNPEKASVKRYKASPRSKRTFPKTVTSEIEYEEPTLSEQIASKIREFYRGYFF